jgi:outer membrane protein OmpA-like peptidoglycan-associated protein
MKRIFSLCFITLFISFSLFGQLSEKDAALGWKAKVKKADQLMEKGSYYNAIDFYRAVAEEKTDMGDVALKLAIALEYGRNYQEALKYYKQAFDADNDKYRMAQYHYGLMLKMTGQYEEAKDQINQFRKKYKGKGKDATNIKRAARKEIEGCDLAITMLTEENPNIIMSHLSTNVNDLYTEFAARIVKEDSLMIYSTLIVDSIPVLEKSSQKMPKAKLYQTLWDGTQWIQGKEMEGPFNDEKRHVGNGSYSFDGKRFYFTKCTDDHGTNVKCDIYVSVNEDGEWKSPKKVPINDAKATSTHPILVPIKRGKDIILFSSNREEGQGGLDIWYSVVDAKGNYSEPRNMGRKINTPKDEITPFYDLEKQTLYFSSNGHGYFGGFDIIKIGAKPSSTRLSLAREMKPMKFPINSSVDDMYYYHYAEGEKGFVVSNREGSISPKWINCCDDIWAFEYIYPPEFTIIGNVFVMGDESKTPVDSSNVELFLADTDSKIDTSVTAEKKGFEFFLGTQYANFRLEARKPGYTYGLNTTSTIGLEESDTLFVDLYLTPILEMGTVILRNVYFDLDKAIIREDAKPSLDTIYNILIANPNIKIELSSHTDSRASKAYNNDLSQRRADSSKAYLVKKGIDPERIVAVGYGEDRLLNDCADGVPCTAIEHQVNRRTEFKVIGEIPNTIITYDKHEIEEILKRKREGSLKGDEDIWQFDDEGTEDNDGNNEDDGGGGN